MIPHYQSAIDVARAELKYGHGEELRRMAQHIVAQRKQEMAVMHRALRETWSTPPGGDPSFRAGTVPTQVSAN
jgi:uncharacterized protein (DUF305 family)